MDEIKIQLQEVYTYIRSRDFNKVFSSLTFGDFIDRAKKEITTDGKRPSKQTTLNQLESKIESVIERAKKLS
jgi:hypothetical protein